MIWPDCYQRLGLDSSQSGFKTSSGCVSFCNGLLRGFRPDLHMKIAHLHGEIWPLGTKGPKGRICLFRPANVPV